MDQNQPKTRVFISCGQKSGSEEERLANEIQRMLEEPPFNFEAYMAGLEHTPTGLMEAVLKNLEESEYFLFIDFKREKLVESTCTDNGCRGSLFSHQELAIATFLKIEQLRFKENGVECNGISELLQGRPIEFDRTELVAKVREEIKRRTWSSGWKNCLRILESPEIDRNIRRNHGCTADFYHIVVENMHNRKMARDCRVFVEPGKNGAELPGAVRDHVEQKWAGVLFNQAVAIRPDHGQRRVCACYVERDTGGRSLGVYFHQFGIDTDSDEAAQRCPPGEYVVKYTAVSTNFPATDREFELVIDEEHEISRFGAIPGC